MKLTERDDTEVLEEYLSKEIGMEDTFSFECKMCGKCCRKRSSPIALTGVDTYNIAKALDITLKDVFEKYVRVSATPDNPIPKVYLKERYDGSCSLLRNGKCMIQDDKPVVCRVYPLGRFYYKKKFHYFTQDGECCGNNKIKLKDWLNSFNIPSLDKESALWNKLYSCCASYMLALMKKHKNEELLMFSTIMCMACFLMYKTDILLLDNIQTNFDMVKEFYPEIIEIEKDFDKRI